MAGNPENLVPEHLRAIRADVGLLREGVQELTGRTASIEQQLVGLRRDLVDLRADFVRLESRIDRLDKRAERIEKRLELTDAPIA